MGRPSNVAKAMAAEATAKMEEQMPSTRVHVSAEQRAAEIRKSKQDYKVPTTFDVGIVAPEGWKYRWVNDINIPFRKSQGYEFVSRSEVSLHASIGFEVTDVSDRVSKPNKAVNDGKMGTATLMKIPMVIAKEIDKAMVDDPTDKVARMIRGGTMGIDNAEQQKEAGTLYVPKGTPIRY